jgi:site-specific recombinase XerD
MRGFVRHSLARTLADVDIERARTYMGHRQAAGLSDNSVHADYQTIKAFANWCANEELPVSPTLPRLRAPKVSIKELVTYREE